MGILQYMDHLKKLKWFVHMTKEEFADQLKARKEEIKEMEGLVQNYAYSIKHVQGMVKASMIISYRKGIIDLLEMLDQKAIKVKQARDLTNKILEETRGVKNV